MKNTVSKSQFKAQLLEYLRVVEKEKNSFVITHNNKPVAKVVPFYEDPNEILQSLRGTITKYDNPTEPVGEDLWEALK